MFSSSPEELQRSSERVIGIGYYLKRCASRVRLWGFVLLLLVLQHSPFVVAMKAAFSSALPARRNAFLSCSIHLSTPSRNSDPQMGFPIGSGVIAISIEQKFHRHVGSDLIWL